MTSAVYKVILVKDSTYGRNYALTGNERAHQNVPQFMLCRRRGNDENSQAKIGQGLAAKDERRNPPAGTAEIVPSIPEVLEGGVNRKEVIQAC